MNLARLKAAEKHFMQLYPGGFAHPEMVKIGKKHNVPKMTEFCQQSFSKKACKNTKETCENMVKAVSRSSMVSMFEKPKFRDFVKGLDLSEKEFLVKALVNFLHGKQQLGFEAFVDLLRTQKLAKWSLITIIPAYFNPTQEVFIKPTTTKNAIQFFDIKDLVYKPAPTWEFYYGYRKLINQIKQKVAPSLSPSNAAFSGFLMMSMSA